MTFTGVGCMSLCSVSASDIQSVSACMVGPQPVGLSVCLQTSLSLRRRVRPRAWLRVTAQRHRVLGRQPGPVGQAGEAASAPTERVSPGLPWTSCCSSGRRARSLVVECSGALPRVRRPQRDSEGQSTRRSGHCSLSPGAWGHVGRGRWGWELFLGGSP